MADNMSQIDIVVSELQEGSADEWYCPYCYCDFTQVWHFTDLSWYNPNFSEAAFQAKQPEMVSTDEDDDLTLYVCCNLWKKDVGRCENHGGPSFEEAMIARQEMGVSTDQMYLIDEQNGLDCRLCDLYESRACDRLIDALDDMFVFNQAPFKKISLCGDFQFGNASGDRNKIEVALCDKYPEVFKVESKVIG